MLVLILSVSVAVMDQVSKTLVQANLLPTDVVSVIPGFMNIRFVRNTGAAWGSFQGNNLALTVVSVVMLGLLIAFRKHFGGRSVISRTGMGLLAGGIIGNLVDRIKLGYVVDFLDFHAFGWHFPAFNVADSAICVGVGLYVFAQLFLSAGDGEERGA